MLFQAPNHSIYLRIVAILALLLGLSDASRLLGVNLGTTSPIAAMGLTSFIYLGLFSLARLFSAVGLWIKASWGAVLLISTTVAELVLFATGNPDIRMTTVGFGVRLVLLLAILAIVGLSFRIRRAQAD
jgi:hypothetical protein